MNKLTHLLLAIFLFCLPLSIMAQKDNDDDDSRYLVGAVPLIEGKVIFSKEFNIPGMSQEEIFNRMMKWMKERLHENKNPESRVVYSDEEKGSIAGIGEEWIVFKSTALSLDRTLINYQVTVGCKLGQCLMEIEKIRFTYREKEKYKAEEWIVDQYALNKSQTKLIRGLAKWRKKTVDFADDMFASAARALGAAEVKEEPKTQSGKVTVTTPDPVVIAPSHPVEATTPATSIIAPSPSNDMPGYKEIALEKIPSDAIGMGTGKLVIAIGKDAFNMTMMTADAGGSLGKISGKPVVFTILSPDQAYEQMDKAETYSVRFYPIGANEPSVILECKKLPAPAAMEGQPRTYAGEIVKAWIK